jgi:ATP-dependent RNA helicase DeaD
MKKFEEMGLTPEILKAIGELGFENPMPVQEKVIPMMIEGENDIITLAQTGTGKTAAFGLPLVQMTDTGSNAVQALILCPTRELCMQITGDLTDYAKYTGKLSIISVYGGASIDNQIRGLRKGVQIIVATPGRLIDLINRGAAKLASVGTVILDEADEMLNMGFLDSINEILEEVPEGRRTLLFSATMSPEISAIARKYMNDPVEITIGTKNSGAENVTHGYYLIHAKDKYRVLKRIADSEPDIYGLVFCRTRKETQEIAAKLMNDGYNADALHGDLSQPQRDSVMQKFRGRNIQLLVATDVAARGLDVDDLTHVINYSLPDDIEVYTHRSGRTGRAGKQGISISLVNLREKYLLNQIEKKLKKPFSAIQVPTGGEICEKQLFHWIDKLEKVDTGHKEIERLLPSIKEKLSGLDREELLRRVANLEFERFLGDYRYADDPILTVVEDDHRGRSGRRTEVWSEGRGERRSDGRSGGRSEGRAEGRPERRSEGKERQNENSGNKPDYTRVFINFGKKDGFFPEQLIEMINKNVDGKKVQLGKIDLMKKFSFFEVDSQHVAKVISSLEGTKYKGRKVGVEIAQEDPKPPREKGGGDRRFVKEKRYDKKGRGRRE